MSNFREDFFIFSGTSHPELSRRIANYLSVKLGKVSIERFPDGEIFVKFLESIRDGDIFIVQPTSYPPNDNVMELLIMLDAAKRASAARITVVIPYYGYARQDRKDKPRVPITAKLIADLLTTAGADRVLTMDLHAHQIVGFFNIPVDHLYAAPVLVSYLKKKLGENSVVVSPDSGSVKMAQRYSDALGTGLAVIAKRRNNAESVESSHLVGDVTGKTCLIVDDITSTSGTLISAEKLLKKQGAKKVIAAISHCLLTELGVKRLIESNIEELITTNTIPPCPYDCNKIKILSVAPIFGEAIKKIHNGGSVSELFENAPSIH